MNSLQAKKDDVIRQSLNDPVPPCLMAAALDNQGFASRRAENLLSDQPSLNHSSAQV